MRETPRYLVFSYRTGQFDDVAFTFDGAANTLDEAKAKPCQDENRLNVYDLQDDVWWRFHRISEDDAPTDVWVELPDMPEDGPDEVAKLAAELAKAAHRGPRLD